MLKLRCQSCQQKLNVPPKLAGTSVNCPKCGEALQIPQDHSTSPGSSSSSTDREPMVERAANESDLSVSNLCDPDPLDSESFPDISEFLAPDEISQSLPAAKRIKSQQKNAAKKQLRSNEKACPGCGKSMAKNDRYCVACGFNDFDAAETAVLTQQKLHDRLEGQVAGLFIFRWLHVFSRFFR